VLCIKLCYSKVYVKYFCTWGLPPKY